MELTVALEQLATYSCPVNVTGDLNLQLNVANSKDASLIVLLQHVEIPCFQHFLFSALHLNISLFFYML